jgi:alanyl-tRNA synthetase
VTGDRADALLRERIEVLEQVAQTIGATSIDAVPDRIAALQEELRDIRRRLRASGPKLPKPAELVRQANEVRPGVRLVAYAGAFESTEQWKGFAKDIRSALGSGVIAVALEADAPQVFVTVSADLVEQGISAVELVQAAMGPLQGRGGGRPEMAQGSGTRRDGLASALQAVGDRLRTAGTTAET